MNLLPHAVRRSFPILSTQNPKDYLINKCRPLTWPFLRSICKRLNIFFCIIHHSNFLILQLRHFYSLFVQLLDYITNIFRIVASSKDLLVTLSTEKNMPNALLLSTNFAFEFLLLIFLKVNQSRFFYLLTLEKFALIATNSNIAGHHLGQDISVSVVCSSETKDLCYLTQFARAGILLISIQEIRFQETIYIPSSQTHTIRILNHN